MGDRIQVSSKMKQTLRIQSKKKKPFRKLETEGKIDFWALCC